MWFTDKDLYSLHTKVSLLVQAIKLVYIEASTMAHDSDIIYTYSKPTYIIIITKVKVY